MQLQPDPDSPFILLVADAEEEPSRRRGLLQSFSGSAELTLAFGWPAVRTPPYEA